MSGNALAVALALLRTPSLRASLRQRALPDDVGELIELAAGAPERVAMAAAGTGETPEQVLEATRFYVRQVVLFAGADAYRVLGVGREASAEQIKLHHRHLQHWLHPDRRGNDWESVFATRINAAWNELRSPERRAAYDARHARAGVTTELAVAPHRMLVSRWRASSLQGNQGLRWPAALAGVGCCIWLAMLVDRQVRAPAPEWNPARGEVPVAAPPPLAAGLDAAIEDAAARLQPGPPAEQEPPRVDSVASVTDAYAIAVPSAEIAKPAAANPPPPAATPAPALPVQVAQETPGGPIEDASVGRDQQNEAHTSTARSATMPEPPSPTPTPTALRPSDPAEAVTLERVRLASRCGQELTGYLTGKSGQVPPIWRSVAAQDVAASIRERLGRGRVRVGEPDWRITGDHASMTTTLQRAGGPVLLRAELAWRDGMWLVERVHTENLP